MGEVLRQKSIVLVPFPFSDQSGTKRRPALVVSNDAFNKESDDVIVCAITSNIGLQNSIMIKPEDWKDGLYSESCVHYPSVLALDKRLVVREIGRLGSERFKEVLKKIFEVLA